MAGPFDPLPDARTALEDAPCGMLQSDSEGLILWANRTFCRWLGFEPEELARRRVQDLLTMGGRIFHQTHWAPLLQMQGSVSEVKLELVDKTGRALPVIMNAVLRNRNGARLQEIAVYIARDRDKYERELVLSRRKLEETLAEAQRLRDEAKDRAHLAEQMVGIVSHDLRNPLSVIHMSAVLLERLGLTQQQQTVVSRISRSTDRAHRLIAELLDFTQARLGGGIMVSKRPLRLNEFMHETVDELKAAFPERILRYEHEGPEIVCSADPDRLSQLVGNLVANAMTYGSKNKPVTVSSRASGDSLAIAVHNFGAPIPREHLATIFLPLERGDQAATATGRSVGLGLYIVSEIAKAHGGHVAVRSDEAIGTEFTVTISHSADA